MRRWQCGNMKNNRQCRDTILSTGGPPCGDEHNPLHKFHCPFHTLYKCTATSSTIAADIFVGVKSGGERLQGKCVLAELYKKKKEKKKITGEQWEK